ncbi:hypothetical protein NDU88_000697 [Pleurodeles waltl]|uniref:Uncharacterized protein n=1 Tax=Pleurodeles waltl TaxID=8319 RepID=A0AAV7Q1J9_PLEWA|nr:hypothetical protein NDU88_000697 [Pleurodeles waltl]
METPGRAGARTDRAEAGEPPPKNTPIPAHPLIASWGSSQPQSPEDLCTPKYCSLLGTITTPVFGGPVHPLKYSRLRTPSLPETVTCTPKLCVFAESCATETCCTPQPPVTSVEPDAILPTRSPDQLDYAPLQSVDPWNRGPPLYSDPWTCERPLYSDPWTCEPPCTRTPGPVNPPCTRTPGPVNPPVLGPLDL